MTTVLVLVLATVITALGLWLLIGGRYTVGAEGRPLLNLLTIRRTTPVEFSPVTARILGVLLLIVGLGAAVLAFW